LIRPRRDRSHAADRGAIADCERVELRKATPRSLDRFAPGRRISFLKALMRHYEHLKTTRVQQSVYEQSSEAAEGIDP